MKIFIFYSISSYGLKGPRKAILELLSTSECDLKSKKWIKYQNNVTKVFRDIKLPLENIMGHWNGKLLPIQKEVSECLLKPPFSVVRPSMKSNSIFTPTGVFFTSPWPQKEKKNVLLWYFSTLCHRLTKVCHSNVPYRCWGKFWCSWTRL